jgi:hypothetical protein
MLMNLIVYGILGYLLSSMEITITKEPALFFSFLALFMLIDTKPWEHWNKDETNNKS